MQSSRCSYQQRTAPRLFGPPMPRAFLAAATLAPAWQDKASQLNANLHRSVEESERWPQLKRMFSQVEKLDVIKGLSSSRPLSDEGAANVMRFYSYRRRPWSLRVCLWRRDSHMEESHAPNLDAPGTVKRRQPRQTRMASQLVARSLDLESQDCFLLRQTNQAIDAGVFHTMSSPPAMRICCCTMN